MSGIAVRVHRDGRPVEAAQVRAMLDAVPYRGPDGMWVRCWDGVGLGYAKLATTLEEEAEQQPLVSPRTGCAIVADARLDNREELLDRLPDRPPPTAGDAELILRAYETWGVECPVRLLGDFAFAIWDPRQQRLVAARDTHGQRWLYYREDRAAFVAASEIQQLLQDPSVPMEPNEASIRELLIPHNLLKNEKDGPNTYYAGVRALPAGHTLIADRDGVRLWQYWELKPHKEIRYRHDDTYAEHFLALLSEVIRTRLRSSRPMGAMLSGGLDSSTVVCTAQEVYRAGRATDTGFIGFSLTFDGLECDEGPLIRDIQAKYAMDVRFIAPPVGLGWLDVEPVGFLSSPLSGGTMLHPLFTAAAQAGVRSLLTGDVADSCVRGSRLVFDSLLLHGQIGEFRRHWRAYRRLSSDSTKRIVALRCLLPMLPLPMQKPINLRVLERDLQRESGWLMPDWLEGGLRADLATRHIELSLEAERERRFANPTRAFEASYLSPPEFAYNPSGWPIEIRRPFADRRLHEFLLAIPPEQKFSPHPDTDEGYAAAKFLMRRSMRGILPESVRTRTHQTHFGSYFVEELRRAWPAYVAAFGPGARSEVGERGLVDSDRLWQRLLRLHEDEEFGDDFIYIMRIAAIETWLRTFRQPRSQRSALRPVDDHVAILPGAGALAV